MAEQPTSPESPETDQPAGPSAGGGDEFPPENPNRPREYHGARTVLAGLGAVAAVALALWLALLRGGDGAGEGGVAPLPDYLLAPGATVAAEIGAVAPDFELETLEGGRFRLSDWRGHAVVLNFWASWCGPCRREVPALVRAQAEHAAAGLIVAGINIEESRGPASDFADEFGINYLLPMDFSGDVFRAYGGGGPAGPPRTFFIDPDGTIALIYAGQAPDERIAADAADAASRSAVGGTEIAPGLKAPPGSADAEVGVERGLIAPDFAAELADGGRWRLSDQRGAPVVLAVAPPGCEGCAELDLRGLREFGARAVLGADAAGSDVARLTWLTWRGDIGALYARDGDLRLIAINAQGAIERIASGPNAAAALARALRGDE